MIILTGNSGFLLRHLLPEIMEKTKDTDNILYHFASPSSSEEFKDYNKMRETLKYSIEMFDDAMKNNRKIIFASSEAVSMKESTYYATMKRLLEFYIEDYDNKLILRIPRVYGKDRKKGLLKTLKSGTFIGDKGKKVEYMDIEDWVTETSEILEKTGIYHYNKNKRENTIQEIYELYCS